MILANSTRVRLRAVAGAKIANTVTVEPADITDPTAIAKVLDTHAITNVVHLAALQIPFCRTDPRLGASVNVAGTVNVFEAVRDRIDQISGVTYASSAALFGPGDDDLAAHNEIGTGARPGTLYGVYKQANEGSARIYWEENRVPSIGLRPHTVYGPGRDQGVTSAQTVAIGAAVRGERYTIPFGGFSIYNFAADTAAAFIASSRSLSEGAHVFNIPGQRLDMPEVIATIENSVEGADMLIDYDESVVLPIPDTLATGGLKKQLGELPITPFEDGIRATTDHFRAAAD